ncbi:MAG: UbiA prenyltransferase family protein [Deferribacterales bacterium]|nr:UbiA prenyltransferase family protein [Deferribacterales bacterium]
MQTVFKLLRVKHYLKNCLIFLPLFFNRNIFDKTNLYIAIAGFLSFCMISSAIYILNDILDIEKDRKHPTKSLRPIASGAISVKSAVSVSIICLLSSVSIAIYLQNTDALAVLVIYGILNILYSVRFKNKPLIDVVILASGFVLRVVYGAVLTGIAISGWLNLTIWAGAFFMGLGKRRNELAKYQQTGETRAVLKYYTYSFLDKNMYVCMALTNIFYALWAVGHENANLVWTVPIFMVLMMKYSLNIEGESDGDPVEVIFRDYTLIALAVVLVGLLFGFLYF